MVTGDDTSKWIISWYIIVKGKRSSSTGPTQIVLLCVWWEREGIIHYELLLYD